ncbi:MAG: D-2-hydroxyacid dehydrogenase, partial [Clostridia bacterium]
MRNIETIVTNLPWAECHKERLRAAAPEAEIIYVSADDSDALAKALPKATVAVILGRPDVRAAKKLQWLHWDAAGLDGIAQPDYIQAGFDITGSAGRSAPALAEHCFYFMLNHAYHNRLVLKAQDAGHWGYEGQGAMKALFSQTIGIVGMGNTGFALAKRAKAFEMNELSYSRKVKPCADVDEMFASDQGDTLDRLLPRCDFLVMCCALTDQTFHMLGERELAMMKSTAVIVNVGRGKTIDEPALLRALNEGRIAGAGLDTFETEPLPPDSSVWATKNLFVT